MLEPIINLSGWLHAIQINLGSKFKYQKRIIQIKRMREYSEEEMGKADLKLIIIGDTASGKSKLVERFLLDNYEQRQLSTYALTMYRHVKDFNGQKCKIDIWDTAGQEQYNNLHPSYYFAADACVMVFDVTRKSTYINLKKWYTELRKYCPHIPVVLIANKIDLKPEVTAKKFAFADKAGIELYYASAADGTNVVRTFDDILQKALEYRQSPKDSYVRDVLDILEDEEMFVN